MKYLKFSNQNYDKEQNLYEMSLQFSSTNPEETTVAS